MCNLDWSHPICNTTMFCPGPTVSQRLTSLRRPWRVFGDGHPSHTPLQLFLCQTLWALHRLESCFFHLSANSLCQLKCPWESWAVLLPGILGIPGEDRPLLICLAHSAGVAGVQERAPVLSNPLQGSQLPPQVQPTVCVLTASTLNAFLLKICSEFASLPHVPVSQCEMFLLAVSSQPSWVLSYFLFRLNL